MANKLLIHIGSPKTGSSALEYFLNKNRNKLKEYGILYPKHNVNKNGISSGHHYLIPKKNSKFEKNRNQLLNIIDTTKKDVVLSSESFFYNFEKIHALFPNATYILYLRRPDLYAYSAYGQEVKRHNNSNKLTSAYLKSSYQSYINTLERIAKRVRKGQLIIKPYENNQFVNENIFEDFLSIIGIETLNTLNLPEKKINQGYTLNALEYKRMINSISSGNEFAELDFILQQYSDNSTDSKDLSCLVLDKDENDLLLQYKSIIDRIEEIVNVKNFFKNPNTKNITKNYVELTKQKTDEISSYIFRKDFKLLKNMYINISGEIAFKTNISQEIRNTIYPSITELIPPKRRIKIDTILIFKKYYWKFFGKSLPTGNRPKY